MKMRLASDTAMVMVLCGLPSAAASSAARSSCTRSAANSAMTVGEGFLGSMRQPLQFGLVQRS